MKTTIVNALSIPITSDPKGLRLMTMSTPPAATPSPPAPEQMTADDAKAALDAFLDALDRPTGDYTPATLNVLFKAAIELANQGATPNAAPQHVDPTAANQLTPAQLAMCAKMKCSPANFLAARRAFSVKR